MYNSYYINPYKLRKLAAYRMLYKLADIQDRFEPQPKYPGDAIAMKDRGDDNMRAALRGDRSKKESPNTTRRIRKGNNEPGSKKQVSDAEKQYRRNRSMERAARNPLPPKRSLVPVGQTAPTVYVDASGQGNGRSFSDILRAAHSKRRKAMRKAKAFGYATGKHLRRNAVGYGGGALGLAGLYSALTEGSRARKSEQALAEALARLDRVGKNTSRNLEALSKRPFWKGPWV